MHNIAFGTFSPGPEYHLLSDSSWPFQKINFPLACCSFEIHTDAISTCPSFFCAPMCHCHYPIKLLFLLENHTLEVPLLYAASQALGSARLTSLPTTAPYIKQHEVVGRKGLDQAYFDATNRARMAIPPTPVKTCAKHVLHATTVWQVQHMTTAREK